MLITDDDAQVRVVSRSGSTSQNEYHSSIKYNYRGQVAMANNSINSPIRISLHHSRCL